MERLFFETPTMRFVFSSEDAKVLGGIKLAYDDAKKNSKLDEFPSKIIDYLDNSDINIDRVEVLNKKKEVIAILKNMAE